MILAFLLLAILSSSALLVWGAISLEQLPVAIGVIIIGILWLLAVWRRLDFFSSLALALYVVLAGLGIWQGAGLTQAAGVCILSLTAWDLTNFRRRSQMIAVDDDRRGLEIRHLLQISALLTGGFVLSLLSANLRITLTFEWVAALILVILFGLGQLVRWLRR